MRPNIRVATYGLFTFSLIAIVVLALTVESSIVRISGYSSNRAEDPHIELYVVISILGILVQVLILKLVNDRKFRVFSSPDLSFRMLNIALLGTQIVIIAILFILVLQVNFLSYYYLDLLKLVFWLSISLSIVALSLLTLRLFSWLKSHYNTTIIIYLLATASIVANFIFTFIYVSQELTNDPSVVKPSIFGEFTLHVERSSPIVKNSFIVTSILGFILMWLGTVLLLSGYKSKMVKLRYWLLMMVPLFYFLSQFEHSFIFLLSEQNILDPLTFNIVYSVVINASRPIGGIIFGLGFIIMSRTVANPQVKVYLLIAGMGMLLLITSNQANLLISAPFPPLGIVSVSFSGIASYLLYIGIYASAVSVSQDVNLRKFIRNSIDTEVRFLEQIGSAQMEKAISDRVKMLSNQIGKFGREDNDIAPSLTREEISQYITEVLEERGLKKTD